MSKMKLISFSLLIFLCFLCCKTVEESSHLKTLEVVEIAEGNLYGAGAEGISAQKLLIENQDDWSTLLNRMDAVNKVTNSFNHNDIDFSEFMVVAVFDKVRSSSGFGLKLTLNSNGKNREVHVRYQNPQGAASSVMTQPYLIVKVSKSGLPIKFNEEEF